MSPPSLRTTRAGFTLIELMVAVAVLAILLGVAAPGLRDFVLNMRLTGQANELLTDLMLARSEAVKRDVSISLCGKKNNGDTACGQDPKWNGGWFIVIDADNDEKMDTGTKPLKVGDMSGSNTLQNDPVAAGKKGAVTFSPTGVALSGATTLTICDAERKGYGRLIQVSAQGRATSTRIEPNLPNANLCPK